MTKRESILIKGWQHHGNKKWYYVIHLDNFSEGIASSGYYVNKASAIRAARNWIKSLADRRVVIDD